MDENVNVKIVKSRVPKYCVCPTCGLKQRFKKNAEHWKIVKDFSLEKPILLKVQVLEAKCLNLNCKTRSFSLSIKGTTRYQRATDRDIIEAITSNVVDNTPCQKIKNRISRSLNTTGSRKTIDDWKHKQADTISFKDLIRNLYPSRVICLDDLGPKRSKETGLITSDRIKGYILYVDTVKR